MFKKGDIVKGLVTGAMYECLKDENIFDGVVECRCIAAPLQIGAKTKVGDIKHLLTTGIERVAPASIPVSTQQSEKVDDLIELRRSIKQFFTF